LLQSGYVFFFIDDDLVIESDRIITIDGFKVIIAIVVLTDKDTFTSFYTFSELLFKRSSVGSVVFC